MENISMDKKGSLQYVSDVSEIQSNDMYMTIVTQMFSTEVNLNNVRVTEAFIDNIVNNREQYSWVPFCVDKQMLRDEHILSLQHKMDENEEYFTTEQIGNFVNFWKEDSDGVVVLYAEARVPKRDKKICEMLKRMFDSGMLKVSFEIMSGACAYDGDVVVVDANEANQLVGMAVVSIPAYPDASSAVLMVAEAKSEDMPVETPAASETKVQEGENMDENLKKDEELQIEEAKPEEELKEAEAVVEAEVEPEEEKPADETEEETKEEAVEEPAAEEDKKPEEAEVEPEAEVPNDTVDLAELMHKIQMLEEQVENLLPYKQMAEANEQEKEKNMVASFVEKAGLSKEDEKVCAAMDALDYKKLIEIWMETPCVEAEAPTVQAASFNFGKLSERDLQSWLYDDEDNSNN